MKWLKIITIVGDQVGVNGINGAGPTNWQAKKVSYTLFALCMWSEVILLVGKVAEFHLTAVTGVGSSPALATCETSQVLLAGVSGGFP